MRLRAQLRVVAGIIAIVASVLGWLLLEGLLKQDALRMLAATKKQNEQAFQKVLALDRAQVRATYEALARQPYLAAYLLVGNATQLSHYTQYAKRAGADVVALVDGTGTPLALEGPHAAQIVKKSAESGLTAEGDLLALPDSLWQVFRIPVALERRAGHLVIGNRVTPEQLRGTFGALSLSVMVQVADQLVSTSQRVVTPAESEPPPLRVDAARGLRASAGVSTVIIGHAVYYLEPIDSQPSDVLGHKLLRFLCVFLFVLLCLGGLVWFVSVRAVRALESLREAGDLLGRGQLRQTRLQTQRLTHRSDEIGNLAGTLDLSTQRLNSFVVTSQRLVRHLEGVLTSVERSASTLASGTARQEERLNEVMGSLRPMIQALEQTARAIGDARSSTISLSLVTNALEQAMALAKAGVRKAEALLSSTDGTQGDARGYRTASVLQQVGLINRLNNDLRDAFTKVRDQVAAVRQILDQAVEAQLREQRQGELVQRAGAEIERLAKQHAGEAIALRASSAQLRRDMEQLSKVLTTLTSDGPLELDEGAAGVSGVISLRDSGLRQGMESALSQAHAVVRNRDSLSGERPPSATRRESATQSVARSDTSGLIPRLTAASSKSQPRVGSRTSGEQPVPKDSGSTARPTESSDLARASTSRD